MKETFYPRLDERLFHRVLPNGLTVMVLPRPGFTRKLAYFVTDFGAIHTSFTLDGKEYRVPDGIAHFLEHKLFDLPERDVTAEFAALGAIPNAFTSYDMTAYHFSCTENFYESLKLLLEFVSTPYFTEESVAKEQGIIGQEIDMNADNPDTGVFEQLMRSMYRNHPVRVSILGDRASIGAITPEDLHLCHRAFYHPSNMLLCVVGDVEPERVSALAEEILPNTPSPQATLRRSWPEEMTCNAAFAQTAMEVSMPLFQLGFKCEPKTKGEPAVRQEMVADLAAEALFGESSELYLRLYDAGLIDSSFGGGFETIEGMAMLTASGDSNDPKAVCKAILDRAEELTAQGMDDADFLRMKRSAMGRRIRGLDSFDSTAFRLCAYHLSDFDYFLFPQIYESIEKQEILEFIKKNVTKQRMSLSIIKEATK